MSLGVFSEQFLGDWCFGVTYSGKKLTLLQTVQKKNILLTAKYEAKKISGSFLRLANLNQNITNKKNFVVLIGLAQ